MRDGTGTAEIRPALALEIARYFHRHLLEELRKPDALLDRPGFEAPTSRENAARALGALLAEFPELPALPPAPFNLIAEWVRRNRFIYRYEDYVFDLYNVVFLARLLALRRPTPARVQAFRELTLRVFGGVDIRRDGFSISFFLRVENNMAERMTPDALIRALDDKFSRFDRIVDEHGLEKIKTIGDAYMCAGGVPTPSRTHAVDIALAALKMRACVREPGPAGDAWRGEARIGFHTGPLVAGVIGQKKFSYDIWGDTVNTASRMESSGVAGRINTSEQSFRLLAPLFVFTPRGEVEAKGKGRIPMYFLEGVRPELSRDGDGVTPNDRFRALHEALRRDP